MDIVLFGLIKEIMPIKLKHNNLIKWCITVCNVSFIFSHFSSNVHVLLWSLKTTCTVPAVSLVHQNTVTFWAPLNKLSVNSVLSSYAPKSCEEPVAIAVFHHWQHLGENNNQHFNTQPRWPPVANYWVHSSCAIILCKIKSLCIQ